MRQPLAASSWQFDAGSDHPRVSLESRSQVAALIIEVDGFRPGELVACDREAKRHLSAACKQVRRSVGRDLNPFALNLDAFGNPNALSVAVARATVAGIRVGLLHRAVAVECVHVKGKRRIRILNHPDANDGIWRSARLWTGGATGERRGECGNDDCGNLQIQPL